MEENTTGAKKEYKRFRALLRKGIGSRTQKQFAEQVGVTQPNLNRLLNAKVIFRPTKNTLFNLSKNMWNVRYEELLVACEYKVTAPQERAKEIEDAISNYFKDMCGKLIVGPLNTMFETINLLYLNDGSINLKFIVPDVYEPVLNDPSGADSSVDVVADWSSGPLKRTTSFKLCFTFTTSNCIVPIRIEDLKSTIQDKAGMEKLLAEQRAAKRLLTFFKSERVPCTYCGPGLMYNEGTPTGFKQFLINHAGAFCTTIERTQLYHRALEDNADMDEVFKRFRDNGDATGTGAVIAVILSEEMKEFRNADGTKLAEFLYFEKDEELEEEERNACIMCRQAFDIPDITKEITAKLYDYARELNIKQFGACYYHGTIIEDKQQLYDTDKYYIAMR